MAYKQHRGFTFIEILVVMAIVGVIASAAIAPLVYAVIRVVETEESFNDDEALQRGISLIIKDIFEAMRTANAPLIRTVRKGVLGKGDDYTIIVASTAPARQNLPAGSVVYRIVRKSAFSKLPEGLYRWIISKLSPAEIDPEKLEKELEDEAQLVLTDVTNLKMEILTPPDWSEEAYSGGLPEGIKVSLVRKEKKVEQVEWFPK
jgi:prepilin-type N-terminal cleavage/methylation domain-containing protein